MHTHALLERYLDRIRALEGRSQGAALEAGKLYCILQRRRLMGSVPSELLEVLTPLARQSWRMRRPTSEARFNTHLERIPPLAGRSIHDPDAVREAKNIYSRLVAMRMLDRLPKHLDDILDPFMRVYWSGLYRTQAGRQRAADQFVRDVLAL